MIDEALELATSEELINELARRETFVGIIIRPASEVRDDFDANQFQMTIRNMSATMGANVMENAIESLEEV